VEADAMCGYWIMSGRNCQLLKRFRSVIQEVKAVIRKIRHKVQMRDAGLISLRPLLFLSPQFTISGMHTRHQPLLVGDAPAQIS
jgi:hypothetical protein